MARALVVALVMLLGTTMHTPLRTIARRLKCIQCNERKAHCLPEPYGIGIER